MRRALPSGTVTFLFTDVEGSTRLLHELGAERYADALADHRRAIREACVAQGGVEVDTQGDAFFFAFPTAPGALSAASALTEALASGPIQVRVGLHTGTPLVTDEGYVGHDVHFAARVAAAAHGGQVVLSAATAEIGLSGSEPQAFSVCDLGEHRLKDIGEAVAIFQLGDGSFPPLKTISNTNLPRPASSFVGRAEEVEAVLSRIEDGARLVTLTGPGGSGKTRLAIEVAATLVPEYRAGVFWVGLAVLRDPSLVTETIAQTLGAKDGLAEHVGERELLLLLDNLEHVVEAAPELSALLEACPNLSLLVTSRELLRVRGEVEYEVPPLAEPEAVSLFCERAQLEPSDEIAELCARLDSLPLAVELAAARTKALTPAQILERISQRLDLLKGGRDADPRQQTLRATIEWSYDLLTDEEQRLFARLSVFAGGSTLEAAEDVVAADLDTLQSLVEKSLLRFGDGRFWMLETIREYALGHLGGESAEPLRRRHAQHFARLAEAANREYVYDMDARAAMRTIGLERDNLRQAVEWAAAAEETDIQLRLLHAIRVYWCASGFAREIRTWLETALARDGALPAIVRARALANAGWVANQQDDAAGGIAYHEQSLELYRSLGDDEGMARCLVGIGRSLVSVHRTNAAQASFEEALRTARHAESLPVLIGAASELAYLALAAGDFDRVSELAGELSAVDPQVGVYIAGLAALEQGDGAQARQLLADNLESTHAVGVEGWLPPSLEAFAASLAACGDVERAAVLVGQAQQVRHDFGREPIPYMRALRDRVVEEAEKQLGDDGLRAATVKGARMTVEEAVEYALASLD